MNTINDIKTPATPVICIDWLQIYCVGQLQENDNFSIKLEEYQTRHFKKVYSIFYKKKIFATATAEPHAKILNPLAVIVKFENRLLYAQDCQSIVNYFLRSFNFKFQSITRADIALDFQTFFGGLTPPDFLTAFFQGIYLKNGRSKFTTYGDHNFSNTYDYLRFGSKTSSHIIYLYNKSKELQEVKNKPWIIDYWTKNGIQTPPDVWRLEFSFKGSQNKVIDILTGEISKINLDTIFESKSLINLMKIAVKQLFTFKINDHKANKTRMQNLTLFQNFDSGEKLVNIPDAHATNRSEKILLSKLVKLANEIRPLDLVAFHFYNRSIETITKKYHLTRYLNKVLNYYVEPSIIYEQ